MTPRPQPSNGGVPNGGRGQNLPRVDKPAGVRGLGPVAVDALAANVDRLSETVWRLHDARKENAFWCFHHTRHVIFRFHGASDPRRFHSHPIWAIWRRLLLPVMAQASALYACAAPVFPKVMLARLEAGQVIDKHVDGGAANAYTHKIHVPLRTNPQAKLIVNDAEHHLAAGHAWEVNNLAPHGASNHGAQDRIHLIFEVFDNDGAG